MAALGRDSLSNKSYSHSRAMVLVCVYTLLALPYGLVTPIFEKPDESYHFYTAWYVHQFGRWPSLGGGTLWQQEALQPPLYYVLAAIATRWLDLKDAPALNQPNPRGNLGVLFGAGNRNVYFHPPGQMTDWHSPEIAAVYVMRGLSLLAGAATVWLSYRIACRVMPDFAAVAAAAGLFVATLPQFLFITTSVSNDALGFALAVWALDGALTMPSVWVLDPIARYLVLLKWGLVVGLATLAKISGLVMLGALGLAVWLICWPHRDWRGFIVSILLLTTGVLLIAGWWFVRNWWLFGDFIGMRATMQIVKRPEPFPGPLPALYGELRGMWWSFWGLFGWFNVLMPRWVYVVIDILSLAGFVGWLKGLRAGRYRMTHKWWIILATLMLVLMAWWQWNVLVPGNQGRLIYPALPAIALILVSGWAQLGRLKRALLLAGSGVLVTLAVAAPWTLIAPTFAQPQVLTEDELPAELECIERDLAPGVRLVGGRFLQHDVEPGKDVSLELYWRASMPIEFDYLLVMQILGRHHEPLVGIQDYHGRGNHPTSHWRPGEVFVSRYSLRIPAETLVPTLGRLMVYLEAPQDAPPSSGWVILDQVAIPNHVQPTPQYMATAHVGNLAHLQGYDLTISSDRVTVTLYWQGESVVSQDFQVFLHLVDVNDAIVAQGDGPSVEGDYPTSVWRPGEWIDDRHVIPLPASLPPGTYHLKAGMYDLVTLERLPAHDAAG